MRKLICPDCEQVMYNSRGPTCKCPDLNAKYIAAVDEEIAKDRATPIELEGEQVDLYHDAVNALILACETLNSNEYRKRAVSKNNVSEAISVAETAISNLKSLKRAIGAYY